ncbi:Putative Enolase [Ectopseudomonas oleovorans]|uniref:Putative Enolase n=1 Tax=Ectopseudomonas oleovorans TaxID=301 RepID=A0A653B8G0_ECTOL|nr:Putative Enolase [Pseudomonas oleovorans]
MGRNLHYTILQYLESALDKHTKVLSWERVDNSQTDEHYIYLVRRLDGLSQIIVHLSDEYEYSLDDYFQKPDSIRERAFILVARPEAVYDDSIVEVAQQDQVSIGKFGALMGALYTERHWDYVPKERRNES